jgi:chromosomal replication initiator protein
MHATYTDMILASVAAYYKINKDDMVSAKTGVLIKPRQISIYLCKHLAQKTPNEISGIFSGIDTEEISKILVKVEEQRSNDVMLDNEVESLTNMLELAD